MAMKLFFVLVVLIPFLATAKDSAQEANEAVLDRGHRVDVEHCYKTVPINEGHRGLQACINQSLDDALEATDLHEQMLANARRAGDEVLPQFMMECFDVIFAEHGAAAWKKCLLELKKAAHRHGEPEGKAKEGEASL